VPWTAYGDVAPAAEKSLAPEFVRFPSFDGLQIPAFLYRPGPKWPGRRPVLIDVHGGPEAQARPGFLGEDAFWVEQLGMVLVFPNVRGSTGYGLRYATLDNGRRRLDSVKDIGALLDWIATQPDLDRDRVFIRGASYGGYMVLASLAQYGDRLRGGIEISGISNFESFLPSKDPAVLDIIRLEFGDLEEPSMRKFLRSVSPISMVDRIRSPLLVIHGEQDTRVPVEEARQIAEAVRAAGNPVWTIFATNEGHVFSRPENNRYVFAAQAQFIVERLREPRAPALPPPPVPAPPPGR
jgi:dipeptidyl aminopeptidase/acylaminoacyl peptidase